VRLVEELQESQQEKQACQDTWVEALEGRGRMHQLDGNRQRVRQTHHDLEGGVLEGPKALGGGLGCWVCGRPWVQEDGLDKERVAVDS